MTRPGRWRVLAAAAVAALPLLAATACGAPSPAAATPATSASPGPPTAPTRLYTDPSSPLFADAERYAENGHPAEATELRAIAGRPAGIWAVGQPGDMKAVRRAVLAAARARALPVIVAYNIPYRDACGHFSSGPRMAAAGYEAWVGQLATAIGSGYAIVVVEPDALPDILRGCLSPAQQAERYTLLRYAMRTLGALPRAQVYLDAGNPGMFGNPASLVDPLRRAGVRYGRGFSANVANFDWTSDVVAWSQQLEQALGGRVGAVIDTSRNGLGPYTGPDAPQWCNPPGRALGPAPALHPGPAGIDAYLWIKDPGASDGPCNGGPPAGQYWPQYALALEQASRR